ncbi:receptor-type tyrosine-protein kinase FLT3-like isoform X2 [Phymastichus coffea]|uniref:receptor-type tyrosine-protein kinase FLT3-like isoform X2 n=1 Tax=Phymastichus coffea TaxID=108790 RepID=UPI00273CC706|nr:receptor-type tyrosine-protein kinase FLT3-like isoform X2 [Phymastichus coffea]
MRWLTVVLSIVAATATSLLVPAPPASQHLDVADVRNLSVSLINVDRGKRLKFNVSWLPPDDTSTLSFYSTIVTSVRSNDSVCSEGSIFYVGDSINQTNVLLPENRFLEDAADELDVEPGCSYKIQVFANPRSGRDAEDAPSVTYAVPECVGKRCSCAKSMDILPTPRVTARSLSNGSTLITWKVDPASPSLSLVKSYEISIGVPSLTSSSGLTVYNETKIFTSSVDNETLYLWEPVEKPKKGTKMFVTARDSYGCSGKAGTYETKRPRHTSFYRKNATPLFFAAMVVTLASISGIYHLVKYLARSHKYKLVALGQKRARALGPVLSNSKIEALLRNNNSLYAERSAEDFKSVDPLEISYARLREVRELGSGQFGRVYLADLLGCSSERRNLVAVKTSLDSQLEVRQQLLEEIAIIKMAGSHPHLVGLVGYSTIPMHPVCLVLEYMRGGELLSYLHRMRDVADSSGLGNDSSLEGPDIDSIAERTCTSLSGQSAATATTAKVFFGNDIETKNLSNSFDASEAPVSQVEMMRFALEIARGMEHLEANGIVHRDLAARNVLMDENLVLKICDFGLSRKGAYMLNGAGVRRLPIRWMPPEAIRRRAFTNKSDVWSYGMCLWEIASLGDFPYSCFSDDALLRHLLEEGGRPDTTPLKDAPMEMKELMHMCWASLPEGRPNFAQITSWLESNRDSKSKSNPTYQDVDVLQAVT